MEQQKLLITGATGNIGKSVIHYLLPRTKSAEIQVIAAARNVTQAQNEFGTKGKHLMFRPFDFLDRSTYDGALTDIHTLFLLRPPQITDISGVFRPLIERATALNIRKIVFLSVQGAEKSSIIPHNKIERVIKEQGVPYVFLRPGYFMQNLTGELLKDISHHNEIVLPAGNARFNWVDADNVGEIAAVLLTNVNDLDNRIMEITGSEQLAFDQVAVLLTEALGRKIAYRNVSIIKYLILSVRAGVPLAKALVLTALHYPARFGQPPALSDAYEQVTGQKTTTLMAFIKREM